MENPSLRVSGHGGTNRTFIVENVLRMSMANGLLTKQLVNKAILMMTTSMLGSPVSSKVAKLGKEKVKVRAKVGSKELVKHTLVKNKHKILNGGQKKGKRGEKGSSKGEKLPL